jgi:hypothetical protein
MDLVRNPFRHAAAGSAWEEPLADMPSLNQKAFERALTLLHQVQADGYSAALVVMGEAGSGKTHLLGRLQRHCAELGGRPFVAMRTDCAPSRIWRHIRNEFVESLRRGQRGTWMQLLHERRESIEEVPIGNLRRVLWHLADGRHPYDALDWLRGAALSKASLERMDLGEAEFEVDEEAEDEARAIVVALAHFLAPAPILLCLDQVEAIQSHPGDTSALFQLGKACGGLVDLTKNVALILCVQEAFLVSLHEAMRQADRDRVLQDRTSLPRIGQAEARELVQLRLKATENVSDRWPVDLEELNRRIPAGGEIARRVLHQAAALFDAGIGRPAPRKQTTEEYLREQLDRMEELALDGYSAARTDHVLTSGLPLLMHMGGWTREESPKNLPGPVVSMRKGVEARHVVMMNETEARSLPVKLKKILQRKDGMGEVAVLRDATLGISAQAKATHGYLEDLQSEGGKFLPVQRKALVALEAMRKLIHEARERALLLDGEALSDVFVESWLRTNLPEPLKDLERSLEGDAVLRDLRVDGIAAYLAEKKMAKISEVAEAVGLSIEQVEDCARYHSEQFLCFAGPCPVVAARVAAAVEAG